jgi:hypothetical protein
MAVEVTGSVATLSQIYTGGRADSITIPVDAEAVLVICAGTYTAGSANGFAELNWDDGGTNDFDLVVSNSDTTAPYDLFAYIMTDESADWPGTGSQTLYHAPDYNPSEGGAVIAVALKGLDTTDPIGDTDATKNEGTSYTPTLSNVASGDLVFCCIADYSSRTVSVDETQTEAASGTLSQVDYIVSYEDGEDQPTSETTSTGYTGRIHFVVEQASAGGTTYEVSVSDGVDFSDSPGAAVTPSAVTWSLLDSDEAIVNSRDGVSVTPGEEVDIELSGDDLVTGRKTLLVEATIDGKPVKETVYINVKDLPGV